MKSKAKLLLIAVIGLCLLGAWSVFGQKRQKQQWEYKFVEYERGPRAQAQVNNLAAEGWELVTVENVVNTDRYVFFLKRQLNSK